MPAISHAAGLLDPDHGNVTLEAPSTASRPPKHHILYQNICTGLAAFAVLVILRFVLTRAYAWWARGNRLQKDHLSRHLVRQPRDSLLVNQQRLHHRFSRQGHGWIMEEKSRGISLDTDDGNATAGRRERGSSTQLIPFLPHDGSQDAEQAASTIMDGRDWTGAGASTNANAGEAAAGSAAYGSSQLAKARHFMGRPPPPPPLTPPELSSAVFTYEDRRRSFPAPELDTSFFDQPNPDYMSSTSTAVAHHDPSGSSPSPRRRSYTKTLPLGVPSAPALPIPGVPIVDGADFVFSPSSYPSTSPLLPPPPPGHHDFDSAFDGPPQYHGQEIEVQGEIISVLDDHGAGWKRHTRVYGGGVCLACAASGREGGFYGDNVRPEEKR